MWSEVDVFYTTSAKKLHESEKTFCTDDVGKYPSLSDRKAQVG
jgi:hypothetical protein